MTCCPSVDHLPQVSCLFTESSRTRSAKSIPVSVPTPLIRQLQAPRSEHFHNWGEVENLIEGRVYPTVTSSLSPFSVAFAFCMLTVISNKPSTVFPHTHWLREHSRMIMDRYFDALDAGHAPVVPYMLRSQKGKPSSSSSLGVFNLSCSAETPVPEPRWSILLATGQGSTWMVH
jgi:hypothetical protein